MDIDSVVGKLGQYGRFQIIVYIFCGIQGIGFIIWDMLAVTSFLGPTSDFQCIVLEENEDGSERYVTYNNSVNRGACEDGELIFDLQPYGRTMVTEWGLVGDKAMLVKLSQSLFMGAMMVGSLVLGQFSDRFGRKPCFALSLALTAFLGLASGFAPNIWVFMALRILTGFICPGYSLAAYVLSMELFPPKSRAAASIVTGCFNAAGFVPLAVAAYFIKDWRYLQIATSAFRCLVLPFLFFMPESVQWLAAKGKYEELEKLLQRIAKFNGKDIPFPILPKTESASPDEPAVYDKADTSDYLSKEKEKSMDKLFMYDSALSLDRDYIPPEDCVSRRSYSSESETEEVDEPQITTTSYPLRVDVPLFSNSPLVNSSISILSEVSNEQYDLSNSSDSFRIEEPSPSKTRITVPMNKLLRKKSVSLCQLPNIQAAQIEQCQRSHDLVKTTSIPNITVNPIPAKDIPLASSRCKAKVKPADILIPSEQRYDSMFFLSIPTLAFGYSQNLSPSLGSQYIAPPQEDATGADSSASDSSPVSDYDTSEEGYYTELSQTNGGYSEVPVFSEPDECVESKAEKKKKQSFTFLDLFKKKSVRQISLASMCMWCATYVVYMGLSMSTDALAGDPYINFSLVGLVEIPAVVIAVLSAVRIGRRFPSGILQILTLLSCCAYLVLPTVNGTVATAALSVVAILLAKTFISAAYCIQCLLTSELLPTPLRSTGVGLYILCSRLGGVLAPVVLITAETWPKFPIVIFCVLNLVSCVMLLPLPEMINMPQPLTPDDIKKIRRVSRERKFSRAPPPPEAFV